MVGARMKLKRATTTHSNALIRLVSMVSLVRATLLKNMAVAYNTTHWSISNSEAITYNDWVLLLKFVVCHKLFNIF
jgi:hypothetical protein